MSNKKTSLLPVILCVAFAIAARLTGVIYSFLATNVIYADSIICQLLPALRQLLSALSFACAAGAVMRSYFQRRSQKLPITVYVAVMLADGVAVILLDLFSGVFADDMWRLFFGIGYRLLLIAYSVLMLILGTAIAKAMLRRGGAIGISVITAGVLPVAVDFFSVLWKSISSLIEWEFMPYAGEIYTMLFEFAAVIFTGVIAAIVTVMAAGGPRE